MAASVTIIIPVYNASDTLNETLKSIESEIIDQAHIDWKVIAIDDGSTDDSLKLLKSWSNRLPLQIKQTEHTGSPAQPRNLGIELATTKYVYFLDADDVLIKGGLTAAVNYAELTNSDVVVTRLVSLDGRGVPRGMFSENREGVTLKNSRIYWALNPMKLICRELLNENSIRFETDMRRDEDQPFAFKSYLAAKKISILAEPPVVGVRYSPAGNNLTLREYAPEDLFHYLKIMSRIMENSNLPPELRHFLLTRNWEIEISREFVWKRLGLLPTELWLPSLNRLTELSQELLVPEMLPRTSIRWRGIVGLIATESYDDLITLLKARNRVLTGRSLTRIRGSLTSNWIRLKATVKLPKNF